MERATPPRVAASDIQLVRAAREEDDNAFEELYRRYHGPIAGYVRRIVRDGGHAEEVAQEAFLAALRRIRQTESEIQFKPWIYQIARNAAIDHHRRSGRVEEMPFDVEGAAAIEVLASTTPDASLAERERFEHFRGALGELSDSQRRIIVLRELEGLSYREIGARLKLSPAAVESALFRARRKLQDEYDQLESGRRCAHIRGLIARLASGNGSGRDRRRLDRHALRCWSCRRQARKCGLRPAAASRRALALLPLPAFVRRLAPGADATVSGARDAASVLNMPAVETVTQGLHKAALVVAAAIAIGGGGATLGGAGPLAIDSGQRTAATREAGDPANPSHSSAEPRVRARPVAISRRRGSHARPDPAAAAGTGGARAAPARQAPAQPRQVPSRSPGGAPGSPAELGAAPPAPSQKVPLVGDLSQPVPSPLPALPRLPVPPALPLDEQLGGQEVKGLLPGGLAPTGEPGGAPPPP